MKGKKKNDYKICVFLFKYLLPWTDGEGFPLTPEGIPVKIQDASMWPT